MKADAEKKIGAVFDAHMAAEFELRDADKAMQTMTDAPSLTHVPVVTGATGKEALRGPPSRSFRREMAFRSLGRADLSNDDREHAR